MEQTVHGESIKAARKRKRYSAEKLGELLDPPVTYAAIYAWEKGKNEPSINYIMQLCEILETSVYDFIDLPKQDENDYQEEMARYMSRMSESQRSAMLGVARAMVE